MASSSSFQEAEAEAEAKEFHKGGLMDLRKIEDVANDSKGGLLSVEKDTLIANRSTPQNNHDIDSGTALQLFLDRIPVSSIPGINNNSVLELKTGDSVRDAISLLYDENEFGALVADNATTDRYSDRYIGFIDFATLVLWCLEEFAKMRNENSDNGTEEMECNATFFSILDQYPSIGQTKHRLQVIPVIEQSNSQVIGFITENAVMQLLLQSSGLDWFDGISNKALTEFRFENKEHAVHVYGDQNITEALHILWKSRIGVIAERDRVNNRLIGSVRNSDVFLLLESENLIHNRKKTVEEFIHIEVNKGASDPPIKQDRGILLRNFFLPRMDSPVTNKETDTLKQVMKNMADTKSSFSFIVDDSWQATGVLTLRDIIIQFAPPCTDSNIHGVGFFESALEQTGCQIKNGTVICNR